MSIALLAAIQVLCAIVLLSAIYILFRNSWVYRRRQELINWHFTVQHDRRDFDATYGTYHKWLYRVFTWNPAKLAGLDRWVKEQGK
jgi:hypothetical protein